MHSTINPGRRWLLRNSLAGSLFAASPFALVWAQQSDGAVKLLRLPKIALVIGNSGYKDAPALKNPANDAKAIGATLKEVGFDVTTKVDASRADMLTAIKAYTSTLAEKKCVGLFYFAGHGLQLAWRNYLLPVDAAIDRVDDVAKQGVDVGTLMESLTKASNAMNVVILDACRENPFGKDTKLEQKGLSQMDAPLSTLLAYATSPGNVASDGTGANGLYTENLLREMKAKEAKIEDVFKRVRLGVRRKSNGEQVPWESTSLEEDFYFLPPAQLRKLSESELERQYQEEKAVFEKIKDAKEPAPLEAYLRRYPTGSFSELVQLQLDRVLAAQGEKKVQVVSSAGNPYTKGTSTANTKFAVGDNFVYAKKDILTGVPAENSNLVVSRVDDGRVFFSTGLVTDLLGNELEYPGGVKYSAYQRYPLEYVVGKRWSTRYEETLKNGVVGQVTLDMMIAAREKITVPAGTFDAFRLEGKAFIHNQGGMTTMTYKLWMAPDQVRRTVALEISRRNAHRIFFNDRFDLLSFSQT